MRLGLKVKLAEFAGGLAGDIVFFAGEDGHALMRQIGQPKHFLAQFGFDLLCLRIAGVNAISHSSERGDQLLEGIFAGRLFGNWRAAVHKAQGCIVVFVLQSQASLPGASGFFIRRHGFAAAQFAHGAIESVAGRLRSFAASAGLAAGGVQLQDTVDARLSGLIAQLGNLCFDPVRSRANQRNIKHGRRLSCVGDFP